MSADALPIGPDQFASALETLPLGNLYAKVLELRNSTAHLERSNDELKAYSDEVGGDRDCDEAVRENEEVINRQKQRVELIKAEVEKRGASWLEVEEAAKMDVDTNGEVNGHPDQVTSNSMTDSAAQPDVQTNGTSSAQPTTRSGGRLTDEQLRERLLAQAGEDEEEDDGVHL